MAQIERDNIDVLRFKYQNVNERGEVINPYKRDHRLDNNYSSEPTDGVTFLNTRMNTQCYAVMFILRRELLNDCLFKEGIYFEDTDWTPRMLCGAKRVASTDMVVYNYLLREGSITNAVNRSKKIKVLDDKIYLLATLKQQTETLRKSGRCNRWYDGMVADTVLSIIGMLAVEFYADRKAYLEQMKKMDIFPIKSENFKAKLINFSPNMVIELLHLKNGK